MLVNSEKTHKPISRLAGRLAIFIIVFSSLITLGTTTVQLFLDYKNDVGEIEADIKNIETSNLTSLSQSVWLADSAYIKTQLEGLANNPDMEYLAIEIDGHAKWVAGEKISARFIEHSFPLVHSYLGKELNIGTLTLRASVDNILGRIKDKLLLVLLSNGVKTFLVAGFMLLIFQKLVGRHLGEISSFVRKKIPEDEGAVLKLSRESYDEKVEDELDEVVLAINQYMSEIKTHLNERDAKEAQLHEAQTSLQSAHDELELRVEKRTEEVKLNEARFRAISEASPNIIVITRVSDGMIAYANPATYSVTGHQPDDIIGNVAPDFYVNPEERAAYVDVLKKEGEARGFEVMLKKKDGTPFLVRANSRIVILENEPHIVGELEDITEQKHQQDTLLKLSHALEQSPSMVFITGVEGDIEYINPMFTKMCGYTADEVIGKNPRILKSGETPPEMYADLWQTIKSGREWRGELKDQHKDGSMFWAYATISPVKNDKDIITNFVCMHEDITLRKSIESREHQARVKAEVANRSKSELMANMSHELRTPLNAIIGFSQAFQGQLFGPLGHEKYVEYADDINASGSHLLELINDILDMAAIEAGKVELNETKASIAHIASSAQRLIAPRASSGQVSLLNNIPSDLPDVHVDERRIKQILLNLMSNAVKFTQPGGKVTISISSNPDGGINISVSDTGIGMDEEGINMAMSEFGQVDGGLDRKEEGTGLGLPLTKSLVELHGGSLSINSNKGVGTTATVYLPPERIVSDG